MLFQTHHTYIVARDVLHKPCVDCLLFLKITYRFNSYMCIILVCMYVCMYVYVCRYVCVVHTYVCMVESKMKLMYHNRNYGYCTKSNFSQLSIITEVTITDIV